MPEVSVIVPNYNHARYLPARLDSVFAQTFGDFEVIVLDDHSSDESLQIIERYRARPQIAAIIPAERNSGSTFVQWARGLEHARGRYVWFAESDDVAEPRFLEVMVGMARAHPSCGLVHCAAAVVDGAGRRSGTTGDWLLKLDPLKWNEPHVANGHVEVRRYLACTNTIPSASAVLIRRDLLEQIGGPPTDFRLCGDWATWIRILVRSDCAYTPQVLSGFRCHDVTVRQRLHGSPELLQEWVRVLELVQREVGIDPKSRARAYARFLDEFIVQMRARSGWPTLMRCYSRFRRLDRAMDLRLGQQLLRRLSHRLRSAA